MAGKELVTFCQIILKLFQMVCRLPFIALPLVTLLPEAYLHIQAFNQFQLPLLTGSNKSACRPLQSVLAVQHKISVDPTVASTNDILSWNECGRSDTTQGLLAGYGNVTVFTWIRFSKSVLARLHLQAISKYIVVVI